MKSLSFGQLPRWVKLAGKLLVTLALITWVVATADVPTLAQRIRQVEVGWLVCAVLLAFLRHPLGALRLYLLVRPRLASVRFFELNRDYFIGIFFNSFMVTVTGGDIVRAVYLSRYGLSLTEATSAIIVERILGLVVLVSVPLLGYASGGGALPQEVANLFVVTSAVVVAGTLLLFSHWVDTLALRCLKRTSNRFLTKIVGFVRALHQYRHPTHAFVVAMLLSLSYQLVSIVAIFALGQALAADVGLPIYLLLLPVVFLISMVPVTINGLGVREGTFVLLFSQAGMRPETASTVSLLLLGTILIQALVGAVCFVTKGASRSPANISFPGSHDSRGAGEIRKIDA